jgi:hypothetical protein
MTNSEEINDEQTELFIDGMETLLGMLKRFLLRDEGRRSIGPLPR